MMETINFKKCETKKDFYKIVEELTISEMEDLIKHLEKQESIFGLTMREEWYLTNLKFQVRNLAIV